jgi:hypothetical protein
MVRKECFNATFQMQFLATNKILKLQNFMHNSDYSNNHSRSAWSLLIWFNSSNDFTRFDSIGVNSTVRAYVQKSVHLCKLRFSHVKLAFDSMTAHLCSLCCVVHKLGTCKTRQCTQRLFRD